MGHNAERGIEDENYFCHIMIPSRDHQASAAFYREVFDWDAQGVSETGTVDIMPPSRKGPSAELNSREGSVVPVIYTSDIGAKLRLIERYGGRRLKDKNLMVRMLGLDIAPCSKIRMVTGCAFTQKRGGSDLE